MSEKQSKPTTHQARVENTRSGNDAETEHREQVLGNPEERNEVEPRRTEDGRGPRTHPSTRTVRKGE